MLCYELTISYENKENSAQDEQSERREALEKLNTKFLCQSDDTCYQVFAYDYDNNSIQLALALHISSFSERNHIVKAINDTVAKELMLEGVRLTNQEEITVESFANLMEVADDRSYMNRRVYRSFRKISTDCFINRSFKAREEIVSSDRLTKTQAMKEARSIMADQSLVAELERIYDRTNKEHFYGFPVHYCVTSQGLDAAMPIVRLLVRALNQKKRLPGTRICHFTDISSNCYDEEDFIKICRQSAGASVVIELKGEDGNRGIFASSYEKVIAFILKVVSKCNMETQFFFIRNVDYEGFSKNLLSRIKDEVDIIELHEGVGNLSEARIYLQRLIADSPMKDLATDKDTSFLPQKKRYRSHDVHEAFEKWCAECLKGRAYPAYKDHRSWIFKENADKKEDYYNELQEMTGLEGVKQLCDEIICSYKMQKVRERYGLDEQEFSRHMVFTGNPGSAKTTVARLLCGILTDEGVLESGKLVECGRADLVGRYVGWTAQTVKNRFRDARGGMLFIDEAYALVDDSRSFGDEAINTIVQEMENNRDSVIVVFAGYPDRMKEFLERNEGLRSRIAFHLNFPDYNESELMEILSTMIRRRGFNVEKDALTVCEDVFRKACGIKDYGNGRFVRNYLEQAILRQSLRLVGSGSIDQMKKVTKEQATRLTADDFLIDTEQLLKNTDDQKIRLGFAPC